jgi:thiol:disulfide interchange protein DsbC
MKKTLISLTLCVLFSGSAIATESVVEINAAKENALKEISQAKDSALVEINGNKVEIPTAVQLPVIVKEPIKSDGLSVQDFQLKVDSIELLKKYGGVKVLRNLGENGFPELYEINLGNDKGIMDVNATNFINGDLIIFENGTHKNVSGDFRDQKMKLIAKSATEELKEDELITFNRTTEEKLGTVYVYTDTTCGYCRKLHGEIDQLLDAGVDVKYIAYPRSGVEEQQPIAKNPDGSLKYGENKGLFELASIFCQKDPAAALTAVKTGSSAEPYRADYEANKEVCQDKVKRGYEIGQKIGFSGTPFLYLSNGDIVPGYQPANALIDMLKAKK